MDDQLRAWYDARDCGALSKSHPFQSALSCSQLFETKKNSDILEDKVLDFCKAVPKTLKLSVSKDQMMQYQAARSIRKEHVPPTGAKHSSMRSLAEGIELADDLYASNEALSKIMMQVYNEDIERLRSSLQSTAPPAVQHRPVPAAELAKSDQGPPNVLNKFRSAKDQFCAEGGQLKESNSGNNLVQAGIKRAFSNGKKPAAASEQLPPLPVELENFDRELIEKIEADIIDNGHPVAFSDISGLEFAKKCVTELICWPMTRPDLFKGLRALPRGILLFGPPGTGKTLIGKAIAHQSGATFFSISASSLMSKWIGEGEKTVRTLFAVAAYRQPSVVFIDEVDSLLCQRSTDENEATRRIKTEFMVQLDGAGTSQTARVVIVGATNRPEELDEAVRRRFVKRIYIPLPDSESRRQLLQMLLSEANHSLLDEDCAALVQKTDGFSGADIRSLCQEAAMGPVREVAQQRSGDLQSIDALSMPPIALYHFDDAFEAVMPSVSASDLHRYVEWNNSFGSFRKMM